MIKSALATVVFVSFAAGAAFGSTGAEAGLATINKARQSYAQKKYAQSIELYSSVPKTSDYWPLAIEERAHTYGRMSEFSKTIADLTTLRTPIFEDSLTPEAYFTEALTYLRLCQYKKVYETVTDFKTNMKGRVSALQSLKEQRQEELLSKVTARLRSKGLSSKNYAKEIGKMPLLFHRDAVVAGLLNAKNFGPSEKAALSARVAFLAEEDLGEIAQNLDRLQLIEAEVMQNLYTLENERKGKRSRTGGFRVESGDLVFPYDGEVWIDELDAYQVKARKCPTATGA